MRATRTDGVALVITLLMLSVITFLAIAFLAMSQRNRSAVAASQDLAGARAMADAALARAQSEIMAQMLAQGDPLSYDYMVSRNYISPYKFNAAEGTNDPSNVNYDSFFTNGKAGTYSPLNYAQLMANLWYDPRPPVFVPTNQALPNNYDFRFWVDINRNGRFETNGVISNIDDLSFPIVGSSLVANGEPEFIGVLRNPLYPHSSSNLFIGRYAYLVLPIGKTLDFNYIDNFLKANYVNAFNPPYPTNNGHFLSHGFARDQGIGSWELNLAGLLDAVSPWAYESNNTSYPSSIPLYYIPYAYYPPNVGFSIPNTGNAFDDAQAMLHYRYQGPQYELPPLSQSYPLINNSNYSYINFNNNDYLDIYCASNALIGSIDYSATNSPFSTNSFPQFARAAPWPGNYQTNQFFDVQDLFDATKTSTYFSNRMWVASHRTNTFDRYTFNRLLSVIGMGSSPEYGVWVNGDYLGYGYPNTQFRQNVLRTKLNLNFDNTSQITNPAGPYVSMPTNLVSWTPSGFFTNAAELLLRSQTFMYSNYIASNNGVVLIGVPIAAQFGVTNIPIYRTNMLGVRYDASMHRMLQMAANLYDATVSTNFASETVQGWNNLPPVRHPSVFQPQFGLAYSNNTPVGINIIGYTQVTNAALAYSQMLQNFYDPTNAFTNLLQHPTFTNINISGIPWVVGANQGLPQFYQYSYQSSVLYERKLLFVRKSENGAPDTNHPPAYTNQFYCMCVSNNFGMDAWNQYPTPFIGASGLTGTYFYISNYITVEFTNNYNWGTNLSFTNLLYPSTKGSLWPACQNVSGATNNGFITFLQTNITTLPPCYFSPSLNRFVYFPNGIISSNGFLAVDTNQTPSKPGYPVYNWTMNITNHVVYALFDGSPANGVNSGSVLLDFVNLGPIGSSVNIQQLAASNYSSPGGMLGMAGGSGNPWLVGNATDLPGSPMSAGLLNQIATGYSGGTTYYNNLNGVPPTSIGLSFTSGSAFGCPYEPSNILSASVVYVANDPMVHYTADDLLLPTQAQPASVNIPPFPPLSNTLGRVNMQRYFPWGANETTFGNYMIFKDPQMTGATNWNFPTNKFPGIGWIGRVHRGTPWQTVYLKAENLPANLSGPNSAFKLAQTWTNWVVSPWMGPPYEMMPETYPTNDWALVDLFTAVPNDNAAHGLLSVNQANDAAWAAVFAGVIAPTSMNGGVQIMPNNSGTALGNGNAQNYVNLVDANAQYSINALRTNYANGIFHKVGDILGAAALTTQSPFMLANGVNPANCSDEIVERIPQETLSLLKVGEPQFAIFTWGQSLKPKGIPYLGGGPNNGIYTNYDITGEFLTRTVCHLVHTNGLKMVIDNYNVESGGN